MSWWILYNGESSLFSIKKESNEGSVDLYVFGIEQYDAKERQYGYFSAIDKMCKEVAIDRDVSEILELFMKKKTL